jgi:hypothetical protein
MKLDDEQKRDHEAAEAAFKSRHPDCCRRRSKTGRFRRLNCERLLGV